MAPAAVKEALPPPLRNCYRDNRHETHQLATEPAAAISAIAKIVEDQKQLESHRRKARNDWACCVANVCCNMKAAMDDKTILQDIESSGQRAPVGPNEQRQYYRLLNEGLLRRVLVRRMEGDTGDPLVCELTELGRQELHGRP